MTFVGPMPSPETILAELEGLSKKGEETQESIQPHFGPNQVRSVEEIKRGDVYMMFSLHSVSRIQVVRPPEDGVLDIMSLYPNTGHVKILLSDYGVIPKNDGSWEQNYFLLRVSNSQD